MSTPPPNYYAILEVPENASLERIREAYKRAALKTHPDRVPDGSPDRAERTRKFQLVNDAYYTLCDPVRRREYDAQRKLFTRAPSSDPFAEADDDAPPGYSATGGGTSPYSWAWNFFTNGSGSGGDERQRTENAQFRDVFEEMMREQGMAEEDGGNRPTGKFWSVVGGLSGGALGFIVANVPGAVAGAVAGNRLGAVRDARGKSVYAVFLELPQADRTRLLSQLAAKVFSHATGI
ncbi:DnaJ chaperone (Caj1) [Cordyceps fumosorosea ARSEF 2679]|uniref:DnaJ chaperone (Caj1) n=1 Tax=Cordyceps fumosorosea (strain ARSEF 2679) TaxID=1081104 RepID=A0A168DZ60_CORFA|nr:DnaJ chaperone (Caj1) [Cordyceps fumosorosea ARSEF 2679]OAA73177.1 DnaJ chaperone (Caj1) [Cordyceps fumosorosea ARSEF 2679]